MRWELCPVFLLFAFLFSARGRRGKPFPELEGALAPAYLAEEPDAALLELLALRALQVGVNVLHQRAGHQPIRSVVDGAHDP